MITSRSMLCRSTEHLETCFGRSICSISWKGKLEGEPAHEVIFGSLILVPDGHLESLSGKVLCNGLQQATGQKDHLTTKRKVHEGNVRRRTAQRDAWKKNRPDTKNKKRTLFCILCYFYHIISFNIFPGKLEDFFWVGPRTSIND